MLTGISDPGISLNQIQKNNRRVAEWGVKRMYSRASAVKSFIPSFSKKWK
jgi:hypothetical protein